MFIQGLVVKLTKQKKENSLAQYLLDINRTDFSIVLLVRLLDSLKKNIYSSERKKETKKRGNKKNKTSIIFMASRLLRYKKELNCTASNLSLVKENRKKSSRSGIKL